MARSFSIEDGNLQTSSLVVSRNVDYSDIDLTFGINSIDDVFKKKDAAAVKQSVKNIILTNRGEKPFSPRFGTSIYNMIFELNEPDVGISIRNRIIRAIQLYEPRAVVEDVRIDNIIDEYTLNAVIVFRVINTTELVSLNVTLSRLR